MSWRFDATQGREPLPGIPLEADDSAFEAAVKRYEAQFGREGAGSVKRSGLYIHESPAKATPKKEE